MGGQSNGDNKLTQLKQSLDSGVQEDKTKQLYKGLIFQTKGRAENDVMGNKPRCEEDRLVMSCGWVRKGRIYGFDCI